MLLKVSAIPPPPLGGKTGQTVGRVRRRAHRRAKARIAACITELVYLLHLLDPH